MGYSYVGGPEEYDDEPYGSRPGETRAGPFADLVADLTELRRQKEARESFMSKAVAPAGDVEWARQALRADPLFDKLKEEMALMKARNAAFAAETQAMRAQTQARAQAQTLAAAVAAHKQHVARAIPEALTKSLQMHAEGKITALDVCKVQALCHQLSQQWL